MVGCSSSALRASKPGRPVAALHMGAAHVHARDGLHNSRLAVGHMADGACTERAGGVSSLLALCKGAGTLGLWLQQERAKGANRTAAAAG